MPGCIRFLCILAHYNYVGWWVDSIVYQFFITFLVTEWPLFTAGGSVEFRKPLVLKNVPPWNIAGYVFAPLHTCALNSCWDKKKKKKLH